MNAKKPLFFMAICFAAAVAANGANVLKQDNNTSLDQGGSWVGGTAPTSADVATWDSTVATPANATNTLAAATNWSGVEILDPAAPVEIDGALALVIGGSGIDLNESGTAQNLFLNLPVSISADQTWAIKTGRKLTFGSSGIISSANTVTMSGDVSFTNGFSISGGGTLTISNGTLALATNVLSQKPFNLGSDANGGTVNQYGGAVNVSRAGGTSGSYQVSLAIGAAGNATGIYNLNGGTLNDTTLNTFCYCSPGNSSGSTGTLNINGGDAHFYSLRLGNSSGHGFVNVTNGTLTVVQGEFSIGRGSGTPGNDGTINVYGGSISTPGISVNLPHGGGDGVLNMSGGTFSIGGSLSVPQAGTGNGTLNMSGGVLTVTNNLNVPGGGSGIGTVNLNGGVLVVSTVGATSGGASALELNGGTLKARNNSTGFISTSALLTVHVDAGGAIIDTTNFTVTVAASLKNGTGGGADGGLTKLGSGTLTLSGVNTYTGPTVIGAGKLALSTTNNNTVGTLVLSNATALDAVLATAGTTLTCSSLMEGVDPGANVTNQFDLGAFGNPATPVITAGSLAANGNVYINVNGSGFAIGTIPLMQYTGSVAGGGSFILNFLAGAAGYVTNDTTAHSINLVITGFPNLTWRGQADTNWDLTTQNWVDTNNAATVYVDGATIHFDDSASRTVVNLTNAFSPAAMNLNNGTSNYVFAGSGSIGGAGGFVKLGAGAVTMSLTNNSWSAGTVVSNGTFQLGARNAIPSGTGKGNLILEGLLDLAGFSQSLNGLSGNTGRIDNSGATPVVLSVGNNGGTGVFAGEITNSGASLALNSVGGSLTLLAANGYSGGTTNSGGVLQLASPESIGTGPLVLNGGTLAWNDAAAHTITNQTTIGGGVTLGASTNGQTTLGETVDFSNGGRSATCNSDVLLAGGMTNGSVTTKAGPGALIVQNTSADWANGSMQVSQGALVMDGTSIIQDNNNIRVQCNATNGVAELDITNGASLVLSNSPNGNLRVGANDSSGAPGCTNILNVAGTFNLIAYPGTSDKLMMGGANNGVHDAQDTVNLLPGGVLSVRQVANTATLPTITTFNFDGGTLAASTNDSAANFFDFNIVAVNVLDGGAFIDTAGYDGITFKNDLLAGGHGTGGLTKNGAGSLILAGSGFGFSSIYGGATTVNAGTLVLAVQVPNSTNFITAPGATLDATGIGGLDLAAGKAVGGSGTVLGPVTVESGALVDPGAATSAGTLTFNNGITLNGAALLKLKKGGSPTSDQIAYPGGTLNYNGTLMVTNIGATPASGDTFQLFSAAAYGGSFTSITLPTLPGGLGWVTNLIANGSISVTGAVANATIPQFNSVTVQGGNIVMSGTNGNALANYRVLVSTNLSLALTNWTPVATNQFDASGNFSFTNNLDATKPELFYNIAVP